MRDRPRIVSVIGWLFAGLGSAGSLITLWGLVSGGTTGDTLDSSAMVLAVRAAAIAGGVFLLMGRNWARWLVIGWMAFHVVVGALNGLFQFVVHGLMLAALCFVLFRPAVSEWFRERGAALKRGSP